jgi:hypothetical protein
VVSGDSRHACERRLCGSPARFALWPLSVWRPAPVAHGRTALGNAKEPQCGVSAVRRANYVDAQVQQRDAYASNRWWRDRSVVEVGSFEEEVADVRRLTESPDLRPESSCRERGVQPAHRLPLDESMNSNFIVPGREEAYVGLDAEIRQPPGNSVPRFACVDDDPRAHARTIAGGAPGCCAARVTDQELLALSRGESA